MSDRSLAGALGVALGVALVTVVLLAVLEFAAGFFVVEPSVQAEIPGDTVSQTIAWLEINPAPLVRDADLLWRNEPNARKVQPLNPQPYGRQDTWALENNSEGFRGTERITTGDTVYRILTLGDSITFGFNVDQEDTYQRQLESILAERYPGRPFEVVNAGVPGWSWIQGLRFLELRGLALDPDVLVMGHGTNDQLLSAKVTDEERLHMLGGPVTRTMRAVALRLTESNSFRLVSRMLPPQASIAEDSPGCRKQIAATNACRRVALGEITAAVSAAHRLATRAGIDTLLLNPDFVATPAVHALESAVSAHNIPYRNVVEAIRDLEHRANDARAAKLLLAPAQSADAPSSPRGLKRLVLRFVAPDAAAAYSVRGRSYFGPAFTFQVPALDDGVGDDERQNDMVYSARVDVPANVGVVHYLFYRGDDPELRPLPPMGSSVGDRSLSVPGDVLGPVEVFAELPYMAERAHPNRKGQAVIAGIVADWLTTLPSFQRFVARTGS